MITLYDQNHDTWKRLAAQGMPHLGKMAKHFSVCAEMDRALGFKNTVAKYMNRAGGTRKTTDLRAKVWLAQHKAGEASAPPIAPATQPAPYAGDDLILVACPPDKMEKVRKVLALMGCEVVDF